MSDLQWSAIAIPVLLAFGGAVWWLFRQGATRTDQRLDDHIRDDIQAHERLKGVETKVEHLEAEVGKLRDMRHDIMEHVSTALADWYVKLVEMIKK